MRKLIITFGLVGLLLVGGHWLLTASRDSQNGFGRFAASTCMTCH